MLSRTTRTTMVTIISMSVKPRTMST
jgi:hypothetical protein